VLTWTDIVAGSLQGLSELPLIREYQAELFQKRKLSRASVAVRLAALRFFYCKSWSLAETSYPKKNYRLTTILGQEELARLIDAARTPFHRTLLMTLYATGLWCAELTHPKVSDVDVFEGEGYLERGSVGVGSNQATTTKLLLSKRVPWTLQTSELDR
jgi:site-specific recombinase XerD